MIVNTGAADVTTYFVLRDSTTHAPKTSVDVTTIDLYYVTSGAAISSKADVTALAAADSAHSDNKGYEIGQGIYRIDWPDIWSGASGTKVELIVVCSGCDTAYLEVEIAPYVNLVNAPNATALNAAADALLNRNMATGTDNGSETVRTVRQSLRFNRNKIVTAGGAYTVYREDDSTPDWTGTLSTDPDAEPVTGWDPTST